MHTPRALQHDLTRRSLLLGALALGGAAVLAACTPSRPGAGAALSLDLPAAGRATGDVSQILISGADQSTPGGRAMQTRIDAWMSANAEAILDTEAASFDQLITTTLTRARAGTLADVIQLYPGTLFDAVFPVLAPLERSLFPELESALSLWDFTTLEATGTAQAGVPIGSQGASWYYNKAMFRAAGLEPEAPPQTWEELMAVGAALKGAGMIPLGMSRGYAGYYLTASILVQFMNDPSDISAFRAGEISIDSDPFRKALGAVSDLARDGWFHPSYLDKEDDSAAADFSRGNVAMYCAQLGSWADFELSLDPSDIGAFIPPKHPEANAQVAYVTPDVMFSLNADSTNPSAALSWINYLGSVEAQEMALRVGGVMPNRSDIDVPGVVSSPAAAQIATWLAGSLQNEVAFDFLNGTASATFYSSLPTVLRSGDIVPFLAQLQREQNE